MTRFLTDVVGHDQWLDRGTELYYFASNPTCKSVKTDCQSIVVAFRRAYSIGPSYLFVRNMF